MNYTRRDFIKQFSVMMASLIAAGCVPAAVFPSLTEKTEVAPTIPPCPAFVSGTARSRFNWDTPHRADWDMLRECWLHLADLNRDSDIDSWESEHRAALDVLVEAGEIDVIVADQIQVAFVTAAYHILGDMSPGTCYMEGPSDDALVSGALYKRLYTLYETADDLDPEAVEQARAAITCDMAFLEAVNTGHWRRAPLYDWESDNIDACPEAINASPEAIEAACILVELILGEGR